jgi:hypothetical protein
MPRYGRCNHIEVNHALAFKPGAAANLHRALVPNGVPFMPIFRDDTWLVAFAIATALGTLAYGFGFAARFL